MCRRSSSPRTRASDGRHHRIHLYRRTFLHLDLGQNARSRRRNLRIHLVGRDLKQRLVARDLIAHLLEPLSQRSLKYRLTHLRHGHRRSRPCICRRGCRRRCRSWRRRRHHRSLIRSCRSLRLSRCLRRLRGSLRRRRTRRNCRGAFLRDRRNNGIHLYRRAFLHFDVLQHAARGSRNLRVHLVRGYLEKRLIPGHFISGLLEPFCKGALKDGFAHLRHSYVCRHRIGRPSTVGQKSLKITDDSKRILAPPRAAQPASRCRLTHTPADKARR